MIIHLDLGTVAGNHDNMNALTTTSAVIAAGSVIDDTGAVVSGVSVSLAGDPFPGMGTNGASAGSGWFAEVNNTAEWSYMNVTANTGTVVVNDLPAGDYEITAFGLRTAAGPLMTSFAVNGQAAQEYDASNVSAPSYAGHIAVKQITLDGSTPLSMVFGRGTGNAGNGYGNWIKIEDVTPPGPQMGVVDNDDIVVDGQQNFSFLLQNVPSGEVPVSVRIGSTAGVGGTTLTGLTYATTANANEYLCTVDMASGIVTGSTSSALELSATTETP